MIENFVYAYRNSFPNISTQGSRNEIYCIDLEPRVEIKIDFIKRVDKGRI